MDNQLFRKESLERFSSPESLHDYMRVTSPKLWMVLVAVLCLAGGFFLYASTATMEETLPVQVEVEHFTEDGESWSLVSVDLTPDSKGLIQTGMRVRFSGLEGRIETVYETKDVLGVLVRMDRDEIDLPDGTYEGVIVTQSTSPLGFLLQ